MDTEDRTSYADLDLFPMDAECFISMCGACEAGTMAQWLRALAGFAQDLRSLPSTDVLAHL